MHRIIATLAIPTSLLLAIPAQGAELNSEDFKLGGFIDTYVSHDFQGYEGRRRSCLTQPALDDEANLNLAYLDATLSSDNLRGRVAAQYGSSVDANYSAEEQKNIRFLQEAYVGAKLSEKLWLDAGVYFSHIGLESFISRDNFAYTRSLVSEFSPYYQTGLRLSYEFSPTLNAQLHLLNGWQNISDDDDRLALGMQVAVGPSDGLQFVHNTFLGNENDETRFFNDFVLKMPLSEKFKAAAAFDLGYQDTGAQQENYWFGWLLVGEYKLCENLGLVARLEQYRDPGNIIVSTANGSDFSAISYSFGTNVLLRENLTWRTELRFFDASRRIFPRESAGQSSELEPRYSAASAFAVTSLALSF